MTPITLHEVKVARRTPVRIIMTKWVHKYLGLCEDNLSKAYWIRLGYEIARRRVEKGEEL